MSTVTREHEGQRAFEALFREHYPAVLAYARRRAPVEIAIEAVSDAFLVAWRRFDEVPADRLPWLLSVTRRTLANQLRSQQRRHALNKKLAESTPPPVAEVTSDRDAEVMTALRRLPEAEREAILLVAWEGLTPRQAATVLGCSGVAFRARLHRARRRLEKALARQKGQSSHAQVEFTTPKEESP